jgi:pimeloyl-ACP methyl ester carboxylesterase
MPTVKVSDINIYYEAHGEGEPLLLIMGYGCSSSGWFRQIPDLSKEYLVVTFDNRGTGQSDKPDTSYTMEMMAGDVARLLEAIGIDATHVYGVSMGGMIAQEFALRYPEKVISLILGCTMCGGTQMIMPDAESLTFIFDMERRKMRTPEEEARELLAFLCSQEFINNNPDIVEQFIAKALEHVTPLHGYMRQGEAMMTHDTYDRLPQIKAPTLVISGTADKLIPIDNSRLLASRIANAELLILENVEHGFWIEGVEEANKAILDFMGRHRRSH